MEMDTVNPNKNVLCICHLQMSFFFECKRIMCENCFEDLSLSDEERMSHCRRLVKTVVWRGIAFGTTILVAYSVTHNVVAGLKVGLIDMGVSFVLYYVYEWAWNCGVDNKKKTSTPDVVPLLPNEEENADYI